MMDLTPDDLEALGIKRLSDRATISLHQLLENDMEVLFTGQDVIRRVSSAAERYMTVERFEEGRSGDVVFSARMYVIPNIQLFAKLLSELLRPPAPPTVPQLKQELDSVVENIEVVLDVE